MVGGGGGGGEGIKNQVKKKTPWDARDARLCAIS